VLEHRVQEDAIMSFSQAIASLLAVCLCACALAACTRRGTPMLQFELPDVEATSLTGKPLRRPELDAQTLKRRQAEFLSAQADYDRDPHSEEAMIWLGRRLAYLGRYKDSIDVFSNGLAIHPDSVRLLRHRGHRYITVRRLDQAIEDLQRAAELVQSGNLADDIEPDGQPNRLNIPTSTTQTNIYYHLGLALYLKANFADAEAAYRQCLDRCTNDDMRVATSYWLMLAMLRQGKDDEVGSLLVTIPKELNIIENASYHRLLLLFKGEVSPSDLQLNAESDPSIDRATIGYGLAMHRMLRKHEDAKADLEELMQNSNWAAFGHIAAEAELAHGTVKSRGPSVRLHPTQPHRSTSCCTSARWNQTMMKRAHPVYQMNSIASARNRPARPMSFNPNRSASASDAV
jgi:tetratricopeptide (TPR) repeat protein